MKKLIALISGEGKTKEQLSKEMKNAYNKYEKAKKKPLTLSKTDYNRYLQCPKLLWLNKFRKELAPKTSEVQQCIFDQGYLVEDYAHKLKQFANGVEITNKYTKGREETQNHIKQGKKTIFQANALTDDLYCKADILHYNDKTKKWDIYEVKSSTEVKDVHIPDLCFQKIAFERDGIPIDRTYLILVNNEYVRKGDVEPKKLLKIVDISEDVENLRQIVETEIPKALKIQKQKDEVEKQIGKQCKKPYSCPFKDYCWANLPEYSIYDLKNFKEKKLKQLQDLEIIEITDVPDDFPLSDKQQKQVMVAKSGKEMIDKKHIKKELDALEYPLYFLDYETYAPAIPLFDGLRPYRQMAFQYSLHVIRKESDKPEHFEYLHIDNDIPYKKLLYSLQQHIGDTGSIIVWNKSFEMSRNDDMAILFPEYADFLKSVNSRVFDLMEIFRDQYYVSPEFKGSYSIKKVLPILVPELSYDDLEDVNEGQIASLYWFKHVYGDSDEKEKIVRNLLEYCKLDTLAMVEVWKKLK